MKLRFWLIPIIAFCMISSCSSCRDEARGNGHTQHSPSDSTTTEVENGLSELELLQQNINDKIDAELQLANSNNSSDLRSGDVEGMFAGFELGMTRREVKKQMLRMKQKRHLVRIKKSKNRYEYVYQMNLKSGRSNTYKDFKYSKRGGVYKAIYHPSKFRGMSKAEFMGEVRDLLVNWYGKADFELPSKNGCSRYVWIKGNRHLDLYCIQKSIEIVFTDLNFERPPMLEGVEEEDKKDEEILM